MVMNALEYAYGKDKFPYGGGKLWIPLVTILVFKALRDSVGGLVKQVHSK